MGMLGGELKRKELLSARLGDVLSELYFGSATLKFFYDEGEKDEDIPHVHYVMADCLARSSRPSTASSAISRTVRRRRHAATGLPDRRGPQGPERSLINTLGDAIMEPSEFRERLSADIYMGRTATATGRMEKAFES